ncbi:MAG: FHA domain-containing protein [Solirubrobacteraceae bacterium]
MSAASAPAGELRLEVVAGKAAGEKLTIEDRLVFGRQTEGLGRLGGDPELSRHHAEVARGPSGEYAIEDLSSTNGTFVNGVRVGAPTPLAAGDLIDLGATRLIVRAAPIGPTPPAGVDVRAATVIVDLPSEALPPVAHPPPPIPTPAAAPTPPAFEPPTEATGPEPAAPAITLDVHLTIDFERHEAAITLGERGAPIRVALRDGRWQISDGGP